MGVLCDFRYWFANYYAAGHSEMDDPLRGRRVALLRGSPYLAATGVALCFFCFRCSRMPYRSFDFKVEHNVLTCAMDSRDPLAFKRGSDDVGWRLERLFPGTDPDGFDGVSGNALVETLGDGFYFGEFGHIFRIQDRR